MLEEDYIDFETAKKLKEIGFPQMGIESCHYNEETKTFYNEQVYRPTLSLVQKWLKKEKDITVLVYKNDCYEEYWYNYETSDSVNNSCDELYDSYEKALEAGIKKVIFELLTNKEHQDKESIDYNTIEKIIDCNDRLLKAVFGDKSIVRPREVLEGGKDIQKQWWINYIREHYND